MMAGCSGGCGGEGIWAGGTGESWRAGDAAIVGDAVVFRDGLHSSTTIMFGDEVDVSGGLSAGLTGF